jgi:hypothetical protein
MFSATTLHGSARVSEVGIRLVPVRPTMVIELSQWAREFIRLLGELVEMSDRFERLLGTNATSGIFEHITWTTVTRLFSARLLSSDGRNWLVQTMLEQDTLKTHPSLVAYSRGPHGETG